MVLLKNDNHTLPLTKLKKVQWLDILADSVKDIEGGWTVEGLFGGPSKSHPVTVLAGLKKNWGRTCRSPTYPELRANAGISLDDRYHDRV